MHRAPAAAAGRDPRARSRMPVTARRATTERGPLRHTGSGHQPNVKADTDRTLPVARPTRDDTPCPVRPDPYLYRPDHQEGPIVTQADELLASRRMTATRAVLSGQSEVIVGLLKELRRTGPYELVTRAVAAGDLIREAVAEVAAAENGCGRPDNECVCPCHADVRPRPHRTTA